MSDEKKPELNHDDLFSFIEEDTATHIASICGRLGVGHCTCREIGDIVRRENGHPEFGPKAVVDPNYLPPLEQQVWAAAYAELFLIVMKQEEPERNAAAVASIGAWKIIDALREHGGKR